MWFVSQMFVVNSKTRTLVKKRLFLNSKSYDKHNSNDTWDVLSAKIVTAENRPGTSPLRAMIANGCTAQL